MAILETKDLRKIYGSGENEVHALDGVSISVEEGEFVAVIGTSGSGKSTLLNMIGGLDRPTSGSVTIRGKELLKMKDEELTIFRRRNIGFVFQNYALFRYMTVYDNIAFGLRVQKADKKKIDERVRELIKLIGLEGLEKRYPSQLSGGQRQRVAFARALAPTPQLLLLDEPFAAIDAKVRKELRSWLREMIEKLGVTSIFVTHDQDEAIEVADEIIITNKGRIEQTGTPIEIYHNPKTAFTASFFGETTFVDDYSKFHNFEHIENVEKAIVRPEFVKVTKKNEVQKYKSSASHGVTKNVLFRGDSIEVVVDVDGTELKARRGLDEQAIEVGEEVDVFLYRIFVTVGDKAYLLDNKSISEDSLVI